MRRPETKSRARALQMLYAWEMQGAPPMAGVATGMVRLCGRAPAILEDSERRAEAVAARVQDLDRAAAGAADNWRIERIGAIERNILRLGVDELERGAVPPRVAITEAVQLAHWFGGSRSPAFVNGVLDRIARQLGRL